MNILCCGYDSSTVCFQCVWETASDRINFEYTNHLSPLFVPVNYCSLVVVEFKLKFNWAI